MRLAKLASQADLCYNEATHIVVAGGACDTPARIHSWRNVPMTTIPPHADNGNLIPSTSRIYKITCTANKRIYIGSAIDLRRRKKEHFNTLRRNNHINQPLQNAWNKYSEQAFTFEILELVLPMSLTAREQYWLDKLKPFSRKGFNIAREAGSQLGYKHTLESRAKMSNSRLGGISGNRGKKASLEARERMRQANLGRKHTPETRERISQANRGKKRSPEACAKIGQASLGRKHTPEAKEKMSQALIGNKHTLGFKQSPESIEKTRQRMLGNAYALDMKHTPEAKEKMSQSRKGKPKSPEHRESMRQAWIKRKQEQKEHST